MPHVWMIRHGQASFGTDNYDRLSPLGHRQARMLGEWLAAHGQFPARIMVGTLVRQRETAEGLAEGLGMGAKTPAFEVHPGLNEHNADSIMRGWVKAGNVHPGHGDRKAHFRALTAAVLGWQAGELVSDEETFDEWETRIASAIAQAAEGDRPCWCVSSGGVIGQAVRVATGAPASTQIRLQMQVKNASFSRLAGRAERLNLLSFNETPHLDGQDDLITWS
ncbi:MAG: hypothetical protein CML46_13995 [Rhodobacteraceae bacterium]|nr:hypothetical protein [Paracoccaceae bacterium]MBR28039.1 hypothetical protein [Paracoccaceae bacterium]